jgi:hypothetical protein
VDLDEWERLLERARGAVLPIEINGAYFNLGSWLWSNGRSLFARHRHLETELARMKGKEHDA